MHIFPLSKATVPNENKSLETEWLHHELLHNSIKCYGSQNQGKTATFSRQSSVCVSVSFTFLKAIVGPNGDRYQISHQVHAGQFIIQILPQAPAKEKKNASDAIFNPAGHAFGGDS